MVSVKPMVVVIGAGITGSVIAMELAERGYRVSLVEKRNPGNGASSRSAAACRQQFSSPLTVRGMMYAVKWFRQFGERCGCETPYEPRGYLFTFCNPDVFVEAQALNEMQKEVGLAEAVILQPEEVVARFPQICGNIVGATFCPTDGFMRPEVVYSEAVERARRNGATIVRNAPVIAVERNAHGRITKVVHEKGVITNVDFVVNATGIWAPAMVPVFGCEILPVCPTKIFVYHLHNSDDLDLSAWPFTVTESGAYCRPINRDSALLVGWTKKVVPMPHFADEDQDVVPNEFHPQNMDGYGVEMMAEVAGLVPEVATMGLHQCTSGLYDSTPDHNPVIAFDRQVPNLIHAVGFSGHGAMHAPFTELVVRQLIEAGGPRSNVVIDGSVYSLDPFAIGRVFDGHGEKIVI